MASLSTVPLTELKGVGLKRAELFKKLGVFSVGALLRLYPRTYEDWSNPYSISEAPFDTLCTVRAVVVRPPREHLIRKKMTIYKCIVSDGWSDLEIVIFNNKYAAQRLTEGSEHIFYGKITGTLTNRQMSSPLFESADVGQKIRAVYPLTEGLTNRMVESAVAEALKMLPQNVNDPIPSSIREKFSLCGLREAIVAIHSPENPEILAEARRRLAFEELFVLQTGLLYKKDRNTRTTAHIIKETYIQDFFDSLPFSPTNSQKNAIDEALHDMRSGIPMRRLVQGDVGSGKTVVAAALCNSAALNGLQSAVMAPTEILAEQHYKTFTSLLPDIPCALLTGSVSPSKKKVILNGLADGSIKIAIGTHALISKNVSFAKLGLVVTDEQHRFGVEQRTVLAQKGENPHMLVMSATPIPRTLALMIYGDLDVSLLTELPAGRQKIRTYLIQSDKRERAIGFIRKQLEEKHQAYIVCPLVEENELMPTLKSATEYCEELQNGALHGFSVALLHGKLPAKEKEDVMARFSNHQIDVLVSTTVIEVGVDVPNSTVIMIENAERFGLSQLHQLRGRVGRGKSASHCILLSDSKGSDTAHRLNTMVRTTDGFEIADEDLKLRGPGDFFGARQHGMPELRIADMSLDLPLLKQAQNAAVEVLRSDPQLVLPIHRTLKGEVKRMFGSLGEEALN